jgi:hypothetical protein
MSDINRLIQRPTPLCDHEIDKLCNLIAALAHKWNITYDGHVFPKLHVLCIDLPRFVRQHKTVSHMLTHSTTIRQPQWVCIMSVSLTMMSE